MSNLRRKIQNKIENTFLTVPAYYAMEAIYLLRYVLYGYKPFSPEGTYTLATTVPTLLACLSSEPALRADAPVQLLEASAGGSLASYLAHECKGTVPERYQQPQGRIAPSAQKGEAAQGS